MNRKGFTLIELLVGITISIILMIGVSMFVSTGIQNILTQDKVMNETPERISGLYALQNALDSAKTSSGFTGSVYASGVLLLSHNNFDKGGLLYIGEKSLTGIYCETGSETPETKHLLIKNFIPFEAVDADIINDTKNFDDGTYTTNFFSGTILKSGSIPFGGEYYGPTDAYVNVTDLYVSDTVNNQILKFSTTSPSNPPEVIVGNQIAGNNFSEGMTATQALLNNPTGLTMINNMLVFSDTLNNRILYLSGGLLYTLLDQNDGLDQPTGLYYDEGVLALGDEYLYISNSGKGEVLKYSSNSANKELNISMVMDQSLSDVQQIKIELESGITNITQPGNPGDFTISGLTKLTDYLTGSTNTLDYYFSNFAIPFNITSDYPCSGPIDSYYIDGSNDIIREILLSCSGGGTGTLREYRTSSYPDISLNDTFGLQINLDGTDFDLSQSYYAKLSLIEKLGSTHESYHHAFLNSDNDIFTKSDNTLEVFASGLLYPTGIDLSGVTLSVNDSLARIKKQYNTITGNNTGNPPLGAFDNDSLYNLPYNPHADILFNTPIKSFAAESDNNKLTTKLEYYKSYNCYNPDINTLTGAIKTLISNTIVE